MLKTISVTLEPPGGYITLSVPLPCTPESLIDFHHHYHVSEEIRQGIHPDLLGIHFHCCLHQDNLNDDIQLALMNPRVDQDVELCAPYVERAVRLLLQLSRETVQSRASGG